jgi:hypothetical protein
MGGLSPDYHVTPESPGSACSLGGLHSPLYASKREVLHEPIQAAPVSRALGSSSPLPTLLDFGGREV